MGFSSIGHGLNNAAEVYMAGGGQQVDPKDSSTDSGFAVDAFIKGIEDLHGMLVGIVVVVSIFGSLVDQLITQLFMPIEVGLDGIQHLGHGHIFFIEDMVFQSRQVIGKAANAYSLHIAGVVFGTAGIIIFAIADAVVYDQREEWNGHKTGVKVFYDVVPPQFDIGEKTQLFLESFEQIGEAFKCGRVSRFNSNFLTCSGIGAVVKGYFQHLIQVEIAGKDVTFLSKCSCFHATAGSTIAGILDVLALAQQFLYDGI